MKRLLMWFIRWLDFKGYSLNNNRRSSFDYQYDAINSVKEHTLLSYTRLLVVSEGLNYLRKNKIEGDIVICGVYKGGLARHCLNLNFDDRHLWLYDTFEGMTEASSMDEEKDKWLGRMKVSVYNVKTLVGEKGVTYVVGDVKDTLPTKRPEKIALLYLDTDFYVSTLEELRWLYPLVIKGGLIIQDDYQMFIGARQAIKEYFYPNTPFLWRIDDTAVGWVKP